MKSLTLMPQNLNELRNLWRLANNVKPQAPNGAFTVRNSAEGSTFYVMDVIGGYDDDATSFVKAVADVKGKTIDLVINSPGGFVWDAMAMYDALVNHPATVNVNIPGLAASAASFLAMSGDNIKIAEAGRMMVHDAQGIGIGSPADMREYADMLDSVSDDIANVYASHTGASGKAWRKAMNATTWYNSSQAVDSKLADSVTKNKTTGPDNRTKVIQARMKVLNSLGGM